MKKAVRCLHEGFQGAFFLATSVSWITQVGRAGSLFPDQQTTKENRLFKHAHNLESKKNIFLLLCVILRMTC